MLFSQQIDPLRQLFFPVTWTPAWSLSENQWPDMALKMDSKLNGYEQGEK
jgi:hypothetical protein